MSTAKKSGRRSDSSQVRIVRSGIQYRSLRDVGDRTEAAIRKAINPELLRALRRVSSSDPPLP